MRILFLLPILAAVCNGSNIIQNPGFESGSTSWTFFGFGVTTTLPHSGTQDADTGCVGHACVSTLGGGAFISQTLNTVALQPYNLSFWVTEDAGATSEMSVFWNGTLVADILNPNNNGNTNYKQFTFSALPTTSNSTVLEVHGRQDPGAIFFDDFFADVSGASSVPEPATFWFAALAAAMLIVARRLRRRSVE